MNVNSTESSTYTNAAYSSKGFSGMSSGIDTESLVQSMLSGIQNKIDKQNQQSQVLKWKQEIYRDIISDINNFQSKYLDATSKTSLMLNSFFNTTKTSSSSSAVAINSTSGNSEVDINVQVARLATASSVTGKTSEGTIKASNSEKANNFEFSREIKIKIGDSDAVNVDLNGVTSAQEIADRINAEVAGFVSVKSAEDFTYKDAGGKELTLKEEEDGTKKYYYKDGTAYNGEENAVKKEKEAIGFSFDSLDKFEISGSTAGLAIIGLSGTTKSSIAKDSEGDEINGLNEVETKAVNLNFADPKKGKVTGSVDVTLDGVKKSITITEGSNMKDLAKEIQSAFGTDIEYDQTNYSFKVKGDGRNLTISANKDTMNAIGFDSAKVSNQILTGDTVKKLGLESGGKLSINGKEIEYSEDDSISSIMNKINSSGAGVKMSFNSLTGKYSMQATSTGSGFNIEASDSGGLLSILGFEMGAKDLTTGVSSLDTENSNYKAGQNAILNINGSTIERASNNITYNGISMTLKATTGTYEVEGKKFKENADGTLQSVEGKTEQKAEVKSTKDVDKLVDTLKSFVDDYNELIAKLNKYTHEKATYKQYAPLTDAQKKEMSEKEIELWEEKAKEGLLRNDRSISSFLSDMRMGMYSKTGNLKYVLSNMGIDSSSNWQDFGKLSIDEDKLKSALTTNIDDVKALFTGENGLAKRLSKICDQTAGTSSAKPGTLVSYAGVVGKGTENSNTVKTQLDAITKRLETLNRLYESKKERYWKQFNAMETALANMNSQSSTLNMYLGY